MRYSCIRGGSIVALISLFIFGCQQHQEKAYMADLAAVVDSVALPDAVTPPDAVKKTAVLQFKVQDVQKANHALEAVVRSFGGDLLHSDSHLDVQRVDQERISADSLVSRKVFVRRTVLECRVPAIAFDSSIMAMESMASFLESRLIDARHVGIDRVANLAAMRNNQQWQEKLDKVIDKPVNKGRDTEQALQQWKTAADEKTAAQLAQLRLNDQVTYSYITLTIYQREEVVLTYSAYLAPLQPYTPGLGEKLGDALQTSGQVLQEMLLLVVRLWPLLVLLLVGVYWWRSRKWKTVRG